MSDALEDREAIRELLAEYCFLLDGYELDAFAAMFSADGRWISRNGSATGPAAIEALMRGLVPEPRPGARRKHFTTNILITLAGGTATVRSNFLVVRDSPAGPAIAVAGTYRDELVKQEGRWRFRSRELFHDIAGESGLNESR
jgi:3-phenylpropionate/cinnamic acid dioxygenase small subunit